MSIGLRCQFITPQKPNDMPRSHNSDTSSPRLSAVGNPLISKGDGDIVVQQWIAACPGWKKTTAEELDALITEALPNVRKAVRWNTPFYGLEGNGWFMAFHCLTKYLKVAFFQGAALDPVPPVSSKQPAVRYLHLFESTPIDRPVVTAWILQASRLPGDKLF